MNSAANSTATVSTRFPFLTLAFQRLCWKEARQLAPLVIALLAINTVLHMLPLSGSREVLQGVHLLLLNLMPCLFAAGAGALLVSQEKELRTIGWLGSLPITPSQILSAKLSAGFAGLAITWLVCLLTTLIFDRELPREPNEGLNSIQLTVVNSIFLLFLGIATAWRWQSTLVALVMIVPIAALPTVAVLSTQRLSQESRLTDAAISVIYLLFSGVFFVYGWRSGQAFLTSKPKWLIWQNWLTKFERRGSRGNLLDAKPQGLALSLLWQVAVQNRMLLFALGALFLLPVLAIYNREFVAIPAWLIVSWLGASVFQSDNVHQRIKFLAERGVAPGTIWWTRQILPFGLIVIAQVVAALVGQALIRNSGIYGNAPSDYLTFPVVLLGIPTVLLAYAAAQWLGQLIRSSIVSLIVAPAITLGAISYMGFALLRLGAPFWMVLIPIGVAFLATRIMTGPWMDGRNGKIYCLGHGIFLLAALGIPALPLLVTAATYPGIPASGNQRLATELEKFGKPRNPLELVLTQEPIVESGEAILGGNEVADAAGGEMASGEVVNEQPVLGFVEQVKRNIESIDAQLSRRSGAVRWTQAVSFLAAEAMLTRAQLDVDSTNEGSKERYRTAMRILHTVVTRMRLSGRLSDQEGADRIERWMIEHVQKKDAREILGESSWAAIAKTLADQTGRKEARLRALVQSWSQLDVSGLANVSPSGLAGWRGTIADNRRISRAFWLLLQYLESTDQNEADKRFAEVASAWGLPMKRNRQGGLSLESGYQLPGQNWMGEWENFKLE